MSKFLNDLNDAVDKGVFNSDAAKKINEISDLADKKSKNLKETSQSIEERTLKAGKKGPMSKKEMDETKTEYENKMTLLKHQDKISSEMVSLIEFDTLVSENINDIFSQIENIEDSIKKFPNIAGFNNLVIKIGEIKDKYKVFINP